MKCAAVWAVAAVAVAAGCAEELTVPGECPDFCPGGQPEIRELVVEALADSDTSFFGYAGMFETPALLLSDGLPAAEARAWYRFLPRPDSVFVSDLWYRYVVDSLDISVSLAARDSTVGGLVLYFYQIPYAIDTTDAFQTVEDALVEEALLDSVVVEDSVRTGRVFLRLTGEAIDRLRLAPEDSGRVAIGLRMRANGPTGVRLASFASAAGGALFTTYGTIDIPDTNRTRQAIPIATAINGFVVRDARIVDPDQLPLGGYPAARAMLRFSLPPVIRDTATLLRATLELTPTGTIPGLPNDQALLEVRGVVKDLGAKSTPIFVIRHLAALEAGSADSVAVDVLDLIALWRGPAGSAPPSALYLSVSPEVGSFHLPSFGSTRSSGVSPPRLRITYMRSPEVDRP